VYSINGEASEAIKYSPSPPIANGLPKRAATISFGFYQNSNRVSTHHLVKSNLNCFSNLIFSFFELLQWILVVSVSE
jgi:hypothetical protein